MKKNIHDYERVVRVAGGAAALFFAFKDKKVKPWYLLGLIPVATGVVGTCPMYSATGINTRKEELPIQGA